MEEGEKIIDRIMSDKENIQEIAKNYDRLTIGVLGSHSAEEVGMAAKEAGLVCVVVCEKGRERLYTEHSRYLFDKVLVLDKFSDIIKPVSYTHLTLPTKA